MPELPIPLTRRTHQSDTVARTFIRSFRRRKQAERVRRELDHWLRVPGQSWLCVALIQKLERITGATVETCRYADRLVTVRVAA